VLVVIDEAQNLDIAVLETVRLLSDFETARTKLLQIIIAGQPQLAEKLARPELTQLRQRISILGRLTPLGRQDVEAYVQHRLTVAGYSGPTLFTPEALEILAICSQGIPRNINTFCFNALSVACALERHTIDAGIVREVVGDLSAAPMAGFSSRFSHMDGASCAPSTSANLIDSGLGGPKDAALKAVVEEVRVVTGATGVAIGLKHGREIVCQAVSGETAPGLGINLDCDSGFSGECVRTGRVLHCSDTKTDSLIDANRCDQLGVRSVIAVPLHRQQEVVGLIEIFSTQPRAFDEEDIGHLQRLAKIVVCLTNGAEQGGTGLLRSRSGGGFARTCR
jgi:GAF domain-containing protein